MSADEGRRRWFSRRQAAWAAAVLMLSGCGHHRQTASRGPQTAPELEETYPTPAPAPGPAPIPASPAGSASNLPPGRIPPTPLPRSGVTLEDVRYVNTHPPILTEVGLATWYTAPYKGRKAANGEVFDDLAFTAAHQTLPVGA